jgi:hypothetical protein
VEGASPSDQGPPDDKKLLKLLKNLIGKQMKIFCLNSFAAFLFKAKIILCLPGPNK